MTTGQKDLAFWVAVIIVILYILFRRTHRLAYNAGAYPSAGAQGMGDTNPWSLPVPGFPVQGGNINVNIASTGINSYFPMFGFVGIDATQIFQ